MLLKRCRVKIKGNFECRTQQCSRTKKKSKKKLKDVATSDVASLDVSGND